MPRAWHAVGRRFALTLGGEGLQSAFHFALNVALVRTMDAEAYGLFAIVMMIGGVALTYVRALVGMPVTLHIAQRRGSRAARAIEAAFGSAALGLAGVIALAVALLLHVWVHAHAVSGALFVGLWSLRSYLRTMLLAEHLQVAAGLSDLSLAVAGGLLAALLVRWTGTDPLDTAFFLLADANAVAILVAAAVRDSRLRITFRPSMRRRFRTLGRQLAWSAATTTSANIQAQGQVLLVAAFASPGAYAPIAAILVLFSPVRLMAAAIANVVQPELAQRVAEGRLPALPWLAATWTACALLISVLYGAVAAVALPIMGSAVFAGQPKAAMGILAWGISTAFLTSLLPRLLLEVFRQFHRAAMITAASAVIGMGAVAILLWVAAPAWTLIGNLLAEAVVLVWSWIAVARFAGSRRPAPAPAPAPTVRLAVSRARAGTPG